MRLATSDTDFGLGERRQPGADQIQTCGRPAHQGRPTQPLRPQFSTATTRAAANAEPATSAPRSMFGTSRLRFLTNSVSTRGKRRLHHPQVACDAFRADQLRAGDRGLADHFEVVREGRDAGQHRIEERLRWRTLRERLGQPFQLRLVVLEQHCSFSREVPEEGAFGDACLPSQLRDSHVRKALAGEAL